MKNILLSAVAIIFLLMFTACGAEAPGDAAKGYSLKDGSVVFIFDEAFQKSRSEEVYPVHKKIESVQVRGTFNSWSAAPGWEMQKTNAGEKAVWILEKSEEAVSVPGNSGMPEFAFCVSVKSSDKEHWVKPGKELGKGYKVDDQYGGQFNYVLRLNNEDPGLLSRINETVATTAKRFTNVYRAGNFRELTLGQLAPGKLYRSYHPFILSREYKAESERLQAVQKLMKKHGIKSVINLTDTKSVASNESLPLVYKQLMEKGNVLFASTEYSKVYFASDTPEFASFLAEVLRFIDEHPAPFLVHCRLGTDRTGVVVALLASLAGADWKAISRDYQISNRAGMGEYRSPRLLRYSLVQMTGKAPKNTDLKKAVSQFLVKHSSLAQADITRIMSKLVR